MAEEKGQHSLFPWQTVHSVSTKCNVVDFVRALMVWIDKPHVVNRRLSGALLLDRFLVHNSDHHDNVAEMYDLIFGKKNQNFGVDFMDTIKTCRAKFTSKEKHMPRKRCVTEAIFLKLLPRQPERANSVVELVLLTQDTIQCRAIFIPFAFVCGDVLKCHVKGKNGLMPYKLQYRKASDSTSINLEVPDNMAWGTSGHLTDEDKDGVGCPTVQWLKSCLLPKLCRWTEQSQDSVSKPRSSLRLIPLERYNILYQSMKQKYGERIVKMWPEGTDPQKFVYEDIAIAAYLLVLWEEERRTRNLKEKQSFVDLGCGNGLLVHLLAEEGHPGRGLDVRQRKIWKLYGPKTMLEESSLDPTRDDMFPDADWLIGNHSDELTPWIPVMAARENATKNSQCLNTPYMIMADGREETSAKHIRSRLDSRTAKRSSYNTRYFVLPCCFFDFTGKFVRSDHKVTQYQCYLNFVTQVGVTSGFRVEEDCLRIPSTKRICHIGRTRTYSPEDYTTVRDAIQELLHTRGFRKEPRIASQSACSSNDTETLVHCHDNQSSSDEGLGNTCGYHIAQRKQVPQRKTDEPNIDSCSISNCTNFMARPSREPVRNCASVDKDIKGKIVDTVASALLQCSEAELPHESSAKKHAIFRGENETSTWRQGGSLAIADLAQLFDKATLQQLKHECGGLQTLLRNQHHVFKVIKGTVQLRDWSTECYVKKRAYDSARREKQLEALWKTSLCWFHANHPDGCPVAAGKCSYAHGDQDLSERPSTLYLKSL